MLREGDILVEINDEYIRDLPHNQVVNILKGCPLGTELTIVVQRGGEFIYYIGVIYYQVLIHKAGIIFFLFSDCFALG